MKLTIREQVLVHITLFMVFIFLGYLVLEPIKQEQMKKEQQLKQAQEEYENHLLLIQREDEILTAIMGKREENKTISTLFYTSISPHEVDYEIRILLEENEITADSLSISTLSPNTLSLSKPINQIPQDSVYEEIVTLYQMMNQDYYQSSLIQVTVEMVTVHISFQANLDQVNGLLDSVLQQNRAMYITGIKAPTDLFHSKQKQNIQMTLTLLCMTD